jgi:indole-3-glycerol phosphate synthase
MSIIDEIIFKVKQDIKTDMIRESFESLLYKAKLRKVDCKDFYSSINQDKVCIIAEIKRESPGYGVMALFEHNRKEFDKLYSIYNNAEEVKAVSILTQRSHFRGSIQDLELGSKLIKKPILRKDFIFSKYQVLQSYVYGADAILLMANVIKSKELFNDLFNYASDLGLHVVCEVHNEEEIDILPVNAKIIGINSRNFKQNKFSKETETDINAFNLINILDDKYLVIAESGVTINNIKDVARNKRYSGVLIGREFLNVNGNVYPLIKKMANLIDIAQEKSKDLIYLDKKTENLVVT